jgi:hypothetical protein
MLFLSTFLLLSLVPSSAQEKAVGPFAALGGTWVLPPFQDGEREYTVRLRFFTENSVQPERPLLEVSCKSENSTFRASNTVRFVQEQGKTSFQVLGYGDKVQATIPYVVQGETLLLDPVSVLKLIESRFVQKPLQERWGPLLKDHCTWKREKAEK